MTSAVASARSLAGTPAVVFAAWTLWSEKSPWPTLVVSNHQLTTELTSIGCGCHGGVLLAGHEQAGPTATVIRGCRVTTREVTDSNSRPRLLPSAQRPRYQARPPKEDFATADAPLERNVADELLWDPRIDNEMIAGSADDAVGVANQHDRAGDGREEGSQVDRVADEPAQRLAGA